MIFQDPNICLDHEKLDLHMKIPKLRENSKENLIFSKSGRKSILTVILGFSRPPEFKQISQNIPNTPNTPNTPDWP